MTSTYQSYIRQLPPSATLIMNEQGQKFVKEGKTIYRFGFGQSPFYPPQTIIDSLKDNAHVHDYLPVKGLQELREAVSSFHKQEQNLDYKAENILVGPGSKQLIYSILAAFTKADVLLTTPSWVSYEPQAELLDHTVYRIPSSFEDKWQCTPENLDKVAKSRPDSTRPALMILNYPGNPDGVTYTADQLEALAKVCREHNIIVIADEIYGFLNFEGAHRSLAEFYKEGTIITVSGLSKWCGAGGWRLGVALFPDELAELLIEAIAGIGSETYSSATALVQYAGVLAYSAPEIQGYLSNQRQVLKAVGTYVADQLNQVNVRVHNPEGGFYVYIDFEHYRDKFAPKGVRRVPKFANISLKNYLVGILPGESFGEEKDRLTARLAFVDFDGTETLKAIENGESIDQSFLETYCPNVIKGIQELTRAVTEL